MNKKQEEDQQLLFQERTVSDFINPTPMWAHFMPEEFLTGLGIQTLPKNHFRAGVKRRNSRRIGT